MTFSLNMHNECNKQLSPISMGTILGAYPSHTSLAHFVTTFYTLEVYQHLTTCTYYILVPILRESKF